MPHQRLPKELIILWCNLYLSRCGMGSIELHNLTNLQLTSGLSEYSPLVKSWIYPDVFTTAFPSQLSHVEYVIR